MFLNILVTITVVFRKFVLPPCIKILRNYAINQESKERKREKKKKRKKEKKKKRKKEKKKKIKRKPGSPMNMAISSSDFDIE